MLLQQPSDWWIEAGDVRLPLARDACDHTTSLFATHHTTDVLAGLRK